MSKSLTLALFFLFLLSPTLAEEPWSVTPNSPIIHQNHAKKTSFDRKKTSNAVLILYQRYISSFDGPRCSLSPTCSGYAAQCFHHHGYFWGLMMTADRLMHEVDKVNWLRVRHYHPTPIRDWQIGPRIDDWLWAARKLRQPLYFNDSLDDNSFWWKD